MSSNSASSENINSEKPSSDELKRNDEVPLTAQDEGVLESYLDVLLTDDVTQPSLDVDALPPEQRPLGERLVKLGEFIRDGQKLAYDLAEGKMEALDSANFNAKNPLIPSLSEIKENLSQSLTLASAVTSDPDELNEKELSGNYILQLNAAVSDLLEQKKALEHRAYVDALTGLGNRAAFDRALEVYWDRGKPFVCAFVDIDNLKSCNDRFGHLEGNRYIKTVCAHLSECCKQPEEIFRIGGDEFVVLSPLATEEEMEHRLEACRTKLLEENDPASSLVFSFSYGCSMTDPARGDDRRQTTLDADRKMYDYKLTHKKANAAATGRVASYVLSELDNRVFEALSMASEGAYPLVYNVDTRESHWSPLAVRDFGLPCEHVHDSIPVWLELVHPDDLEHVRDGLERMASGEVHNHRIQYRVKDVTGRYVLCESRGYRLEGTDGMPTIYVGYIINRSAAEVTDPATGLGNFRGLMSALGETRTKGCSVGLVGVKVNGIAEINRKYGYDAGDHVMSEIAGRIVSRMRAAARMFRSRGVKLVVVADGANEPDTEAFEHSLRAALSEPVLIGNDRVFVPISIASLYYQRVQVQPAKVIREIDRRIEVATEELFEESNTEVLSNTQQRTRFDRLTGLSVGSWFLDESTRLREIDPAVSWCIVKIDLGRMTIFNEWYGRDRGDALLAEVGSLLQQFEEDYDCVCGYWGQDDFCVFMPFDLDTVHTMYARLKGLIAEFSNATDFLPAMGIYRIALDEPVSQCQYEYARFASKGAKQMMGDRIRLFRTTEYRRADCSRRIIGGFEHALSNNELMFYVQPQVDMNDRSIVGCEALARWRHEDGTFISPAEFVPALEETGLITMLDQLIWAQVFQWLGERIAEGKLCVPVSINVSRVDVLAFDVVGHLKELFKRYAVPVEMIRVEITESACTGGGDRLGKLTEGLHDLGVLVHMDDFGTGHSSLGMLGTVDVDALKLDRAFIADEFEGDVRRVKVVRSILAMAEALRVPVVVEGVETPQQAQLLRTLGAQYAQGFCYYRPMVHEELDRLLDVME